MHWLERQIAELDRLAEDYLDTQRRQVNDIVLVSEDMRDKRRCFIEALQTLVDRVVKIKGVSACVAFHEGLVLAGSGKLPNVDALGAMIQESIGVALKGAGILSLGEIRQIVIVGETDKVAMLSVGPVILCITSPKAVNLASALSRGK